MNDMHCQNRQALLRKVQQHYFAMVDAGLYLDGHPKNKRALAYYEEHRKIAAMLRAEYEQKYGPLSITGNNDTTAWRWVDAPWPWEKEAN